MSKEIVRAGVRYNNKVYDGFNRGECFKKLPTEANMVNVEQGFITNDGEFVDREKAFTIARKAHQLEYDYGIQKTLTSEDIHINWLHKKDKIIADLEAKLELSKMNESFEKEKKENAWKFIEQLKQQLAEKDKEILEVKNWWSYQYKGEIERKEQDKISFAIEQLVNIQKYITDNVVFVEEECFGREINEYIDNQIEELKKEMK